MTIIHKCNTIHTTAKMKRSIEWIVMHYTAGVTSKYGSASSLAEYFATRKDNCSADFAVDDVEVVQYNPDIRNRYTWHCGGNKYNNSGGKFYGICTNANSIGIEVCSTNSTGKMQSANDKSYSFTDSAIENSKELVKYLMKEYGIDKDHVIRHYDVNGKPCPGVIGWNKESGSEEKWEKFKASISNCGNTKYFVQVGAFSNRENAEKYLEEVKKVYPNAFIKTI